MSSKSRELNSSFGRLIPESELPFRQKASIPLTEILALCKRIEPGWALAGTEEEMGVRLSSLRHAVKRLKAEGLVPKTFWIHESLEKNGVRHIYIVNHEQREAPQ